MNQHHHKPIPLPPPLFVPTCMRCGAECLDSEVYCFGCHLEMDVLILEDIAAEHE